MNSFVEPEWEDVLSAPLSVERNGTTFSLTAYLWQDFQPLIITGGALAQEEWEPWCECTGQTSAALTWSQPLSCQPRRSAASDISPHAA